MKYSRRKNRRKNRREENVIAVTFSSLLLFLLFPLLFCITLGIECIILDCDSCHMLFSSSCAISCKYLHESSSKILRITQLARRHRFFFLVRNVSANYEHPLRQDETRKRRVPRRRILEKSDAKIRRQGGAAEGGVSTERRSSEVERLWSPPVFVPIILLIVFDATNYDPEHESFE